MAKQNFYKAAVNLNQNNYMPVKVVPSVFKEYFKENF